MKDYNLDFPNLKIPEVKMPKFDIPDIPDFSSDYDKIYESINQANQTIIEKNQREVENNESLKAIVAYNEDISRYNRELVSLNEKILNKINSLDDTLTFLNETFSNKSTNDVKHSEQQLSLLLELITIIENKDSSKLETFMNNIGAPVGVGLFIEALKFQLGLG